MCLKLQPSQVLYFLKERSLCYDLIPLLLSGGWGGGKVTQHRECGEQAGSGIRTGAQRWAANSLALVGDGQENSSLREQGLLDVVSNHWFGSWLWFSQPILPNPLPTQASWNRNREGIFPTTSLLEKRTQGSFFMLFLLYAVFMLSFLLFKA